MNLTWHIVKKDLRSLWAPLALWALLVVAQVGVGVNLLFGQGSADGLWFQRMIGYNYVLVSLDLLFAYVLVSALLHEDSLVGTTVFWRTRPISGGRLLGAKLMGAAIMFGALPVLIWLPWWLTCNYGWREIAGAVPEILGMHAVAVMAALLVAVLTDNLGRFLGWTIMLAITLATLVLALASSSQPTTMIGIEEANARAALTESRAVMAFTVLMAVIVIAVIQQFMARRPAWVFAQVLAGFGLATLVCTHYPWDFSLLWLPDDELPPFEQAQSQVSGVTLAFDQARLWHNPDEATGEKRRSPVAVGLLMQGIPQGMEAYGQFADQTWRWPDGTVVRTRTRGLTGSTGGLQAVLGLPPRKMDLNWLNSLEARRPSLGMMPSPYYEIVIARNGVMGLGAHAELTRAEVARVRAEPPSYVLNAQFGLIQYDEKTELPLHSAERRRVDRTSLRAVEVEQIVVNRAVATTTMRVAVLESRPTSYADGLDRLSPFQGLHEQNERSFRTGRSSYYLINRDRGNRADVWTEQYPSVRVGTVEITRRVLQFNAPRDWSADNHWVPQPGWFEKAKLVRVTAREVARFSRELKVDRFEVQP